MKDAKKTKAPKAKALPFPAPKKTVAPIGHNRPGVDPFLVSKVEALERIGAQKKALAKEEKAIKSEVKANGIPLVELSIVLRKRRLDPETRVQQELNCFDIQARLGEQITLPGFDLLPESHKPKVEVAAEPAAPVANPAEVAKARGDAPADFGPSSTVAH